MTGNDGNWVFRRTAVACGALFLLTTILYGIYGPLTLLSQVDGKILYDTTQVVLINEVFKFVISAALLAKTSKLGDFSLRDAAPYFIPAFCYFFNNNSSFYILTYLDPASFSVLTNLKILSSAALYRIIMKKSPTVYELGALVILVIASCLHSYGSLAPDNPDATWTNQLRVTPYGIALLLFSITLTSFAGVYTEYTLKKQHNVSLYKQNMYLYFAGILFNSIPFVSKGGASGSWRLFSGFNHFVWLIVLDLSILGLCVSYVMKISTTITRLVLTCASILVTTLLSVIIFQFQITLYFILSSFLVVLALIIYNIKTDADDVASNVQVTDTKE